MEQKVHVIGAGLSGCEAAYFLAEHGVQVLLHEMRPAVQTPAHKSGHCAELVCSNSFKSKDSDSAPGILKAEMNAMGSLILRAAGSSAVPAGSALAVNRDLFSEAVTRAIKSHPNITLVSGEVTEPFKGAINLLASGPLTSETLCTWLGKATGEDSLYFYDAIAPIIDASTVDMSKAFLANRYDKGDEEAYLNCPFNEDEYYAFISALMAAEKVPPRNFEKEVFFQGCQPIEAIANTGRDSLRFGPMKPVGLKIPNTDQRPFAVVQLRPENRERTAYNLVGFQTKLKYEEQRRIFRMIPGLQNVEFMRLGSIHRNTFVCGPKVLRPDLSLKGHPMIYLAGQLAGVEGYLESTACGLLAANFIIQRLRGVPHHAPPANTALGALLRHLIGQEPKNFMPSNVHFGLFDATLFDGTASLKKDQLRKAIAAQAPENLKKWWQSQSI